MDPKFAEMFAPVVAMAVMAWIVHIIAKAMANTRRLRTQAELQRRLLEKFNSSTELLEYLSSDAGLRFIESATLERSNPYSRILSAVQAGAVLAMLGIACLFLRGQLTDAEPAFAVFGALGLALGVGFLISAGISFLLAKSWGLINGHDKLPGGEV